MDFVTILDLTRVSSATLTRMASRKGSKVNVDTVEKLCRYFNCTPNDLITIIPDPPASEESTKKAVVSSDHHQLPV